MRLKTGHKPGELLEGSSQRFIQSAFAGAVSAPRKPGRIRANLFKRGLKKKMKQKILFAVLLLNAIFSIAVLCLYGCLEDRQLEVMASIAGDRCRHGGGKYGNGGCVPVLRTADGFMFEAVGILIPPPLPIGKLSSENYGFYARHGDDRDCQNSIAGVPAMSKICHRPLIEWVHGQPNSNSATTQEISTMENAPRSNEAIPLYRPFLGYRWISFGCPNERRGVCFCERNRW